MNKTYLEFVKEYLENADNGTPIYTNQIAKKVSVCYGLNYKEAAAATAVAIKRIVDGNILIGLKCYQKGIYYRSVKTPFGETGINKEKLIADKYILPCKGYETGLFLLHRMGLTSQMPKERILATNMAKECARVDKKLGVTIRPPKVTITAENKPYLQILDALEILEKAPVDEERPYEILAGHIKKQELRFDVLLTLAYRYYNKDTVMKLAHTASEGGVVIETS